MTIKSAEPSANTFKGQRGNIQTTHAEAVLCFPASVLTDPSAAVAKLS